MLNIIQIFFKRAVEREEILDEQSDEDKALVFGLTGSQIKTAANAMMESEAHDSPLRQYEVVA